MPLIKKLYYGCKEELRENFLHADQVSYPHLDFQCKPWEVSAHMLELDYIYANGVLEYLTNYEADRALRDWLKSLRLNGSIELILPNMDYYCKEWLRAQWSEDTLKDKHSLAQVSFQGLWGEQKECDPWQKKYDTSYIWVHKSGYNQQRIELLLSRIGFDNIVVTSKDEATLLVKATKPKSNGERQVGTNLATIRKDHRNRYMFANQFIDKENALVADAACGVGYGSYILAQNEKIKKIQSLDISKDALKHAHEYFFHEKINYIHTDLSKEPLDSLEKVDYLISFETIEHLQHPEEFIDKITKALKNDGLFIGSTPNEEVMPFIQQNFLYHTKHFTQDELAEILHSHGFRDVKFFQQRGEEPSLIEEIKDGHYIIFVARKS